MANIPGGNGGGTSGAASGQCRTPALLGGVALTFSTPNVSVDAEARTKEHKILDNETVVQHMGRNAEQVTCEGICDVYEATGLRTMVDLDQTRFRSFEWSGDVIVKSVSVDKLLGQDPESNEWLYEYSVEMIEVSPTAPSRSTYTVTGGGGGGGGGGGSNAIGRMSDQGGGPRGNI